MRFILFASLGLLLQDPLVRASDFDFSIEELIVQLRSTPSADITSPDEDVESSEGFYSFSLGAGWRGDFIPDGLIYPRYISDPYRPTIAVKYLNFFDTKVPEAGDSRYLFEFGLRTGLFRVNWGEESRYALQVDIMAGWMGQFDLEQSQDVLGWDGLYGYFLTFSNGNGFSVQLGNKHQSSHIGDEFIERTGAQRLGYSRGEWVLGLSLKEWEYWRIYGEGGYGEYLLNEDLQEPWRVQGGLEFENPKLLFDEKAGCYAAVNLTAYQESDWSVDTTVQAGLVFPKPGFAGTWRLGLEYRNGRSLMGEFFLYKESYLALGVWLDF